MICLDANVFVASARETEPHHRVSRQLLRTGRVGGPSLCTSSLALAEVAGALSRRTGDADLGRRWAEVLRTFHRLTLVPLDATLADRAAELAAVYRLRGADAVYAATAAHLGATLVTWDDEVIRRLAGVAPVFTPAAWLASHPA